MQRKNKGTVWLSAPSAMSSILIHILTAGCSLPAPTLLPPAGQPELGLEHQSLAHSHQLPLTATTLDRQAASIM